jgi:hypothetical protein
VTSIDSPTLQLPPLFEVGSYGFEIHEMTEMACAKFGQDANSNPPIHHVVKNAFPIQDPA